MTVFRGISEESDLLLETFRTATLSLFVSLERWRALGYSGTQQRGIETLMARAQALHSSSNEVPDDACV